MIWPRRTARTSWFQFTPLGLSTHSPCVIRSAPRRNESGRVAPVPPIGPLVSLASGLRSPPETPNGWPPGRGRPCGWPQAASSSRTASLCAGLVRVHRQVAIIAATRRPACPPETPFGWQGAALALRKRSPRKSGPTAPRHRIIARLYNVGVGGILAQHLAKCCPCRPLQARLTALCEPCGTPPVALAGCALRQGPARCTSHGPRLDRRAAPHRDRHSPFAPLRSGGPQAARLRLRGCCAAPVGHCSARVALRASLHRSPGRGYDKLHRRPGARLGPPFRATQDTPRCAPGFLNALRLTFPPDGAEPPPGDLAIQSCTKVSQNPLKSASNHLKSCSNVPSASYCSCDHNIFNQANRQPEVGRSNS